MSKKSDSNLIITYVKKIKAINYLGGSCLKCNERNIFKLCFHHKNPLEKNYDWSDLKYKSYNDIIKELNKCELLCNNCHSEFHYLENKNYNNKIRDSKLILLSLKEKIECVECGYNKCIASLDFHHINKNDKNFMIGSKATIICNKNHISDIFINEIEKCDIICKNCHVLKHSNIDFFNNNIEKIKEKVENYKEYKKLNYNEVYSKYLNGDCVTKLSKEYNVNKSTISTIIKRIKSKNII